MVSLYHVLIYAVDMLILMYKVRALLDWKFSDMFIITQTVMGNLSEQRLSKDWHRNVGNSVSKILDLFMEMDLFICVSKGRINRF